jgi:predicted N-acetyltransferase YhbS
MIEIRKMGLGDSDAITQLTEQLGYPSNGSKILKRIKLLLASSGNCAFVAVIDHQVVGWIHAFHTVRIESDPFVEIAGLVVDIDHRNKQIGKNLIKEVQDWGKNFDIQTIKVRCNIIREDSHLFYQKAGFSLSKTQKIFEMKS